MVLLVLALLLILFYENPVYAVFSFIFIALGFFLFLLFFQLEFFALLILIIYVGVITVLFLFVVIMYNLAALRFQFSFYLPLFICFVIVFFSFLLLNTLFQPLLYVFFLPLTPVALIDITFFENLYNFSGFILFFCALLLFLAMLGSIVITFSFYYLQSNV